MTGSRDFTNVEVIRQALTDEYSRAKNPDQDGLIIIHGGARGADSIADRLATDSPIATVVRVPADWEHRPRWQAGPIRNQHMLELLPDVVLAFFKTGAGNRGTQNCVNQARERGIEVKEYTSD